MTIDTFIRSMNISLIESILDFYIRNNWGNSEFVLLLSEKLRRIEEYE